MIAFRHGGAEAADVAFGPDGRLHVVTRMPGVVEVFDDGAFVRAYGLGILSGRPHAVTVAPDGVSYVVDEPEHVVQVFAADGAHLGTIGVPGQPSDTGLDPTLPGPLRHTTVVRAGAPFNQPTKVAVAADGTLLVADGYGNARVHRLRSDGTLLGGWGEPGIGPGQLRLPHGIAVLRDGTVAVADRGNDRVQLFDPEGRWLSSWQDLHLPCSVAQAPDGTVWVTELASRADPYDPASPLREPARVTAFRPDGTAARRATAVRVGGELVPLAAPHGIAVSDRGVVIAEVRFTVTRRREHGLHVYPELVEG